MKCLTSDDLERMAFAHPGTAIEIDAERGIAVLDIGRATYYARLDDATAEAAS